MWPWDLVIFAQIANLIGICILDMSGWIINLLQIGLYRYDGLIFIPNCNSPKISKLQKKIIKAFRSLGLKIEYIHSKQETKIV